MIPSLTTEPTIVPGRWCFGCGSRRVPRWIFRPDGKLRVGIRVVWHEDICNRGPRGSCEMADAVAGIRPQREAP